MNLFASDAAAIASYGQIVLINLVLSADNVVVVGLAAAGLAPHLRARAIAGGIATATAVRIAFALLATQLMGITGLVLAGGMLLLWVCWRMYRELRATHLAHASVADGGSAEAPLAAGKSFGQALVQIVVADVSMSLDNVLAVAGAARQNPGALVFGLILSVLLMGIAAAQLAKLLDRYRWISWLGLLIITWVAASMVREGAMELLRRA